jgi:hypothetical protein
LEEIQLVLVAVDAVVVVAVTAVDIIAGFGLAVVASDWLQVDSVRIAAGRDRIVLLAAIVQVVAVQNDWGQVVWDKWEIVGLCLVSVALAVAVAAVAVAAAADVAEPTASAASVPDSAARIVVVYEVVNLQS